MQQAFTGMWDHKLAWELLVELMPKPGNRPGQLQYSNSGYGISATILFLTLERIGRRLLSYAAWRDAHE